MYDLKAGDIITDSHGIRKEILGRVSDLVFTQLILESGAREQVLGPVEIEDLVTWGFDVKDLIA